MLAITSSFSQQAVLWQLYIHEKGLKNTLPTRSRNVANKSNLDLLGSISSTFNVHLCRSHKHKKDSKVISHFALLGSTHVKALRKHVGEIDPLSSTERFTDLSMLILLMVV